MTIKDNLQHIRHRIADIAHQCDRDPKMIKLLAVSKTKPISLIEEAIEANQVLFGENYVQECVEKITYFKAHPTNPPLEWHFIGPLQSNKSRLIAENADWVHTIDRLKIAKRLNEQRPVDLSPLNVLIQVNISHESTKSGVNEGDVFMLAQQLSQFPNLTLRGLMTIPEVTLSHEKQLATFQKMNQLYKALQNNFPNIDTLSMGMSDDIEAAIMAGSTMVRIGTAIFGARQYN